MNTAYIKRFSVDLSSFSEKEKTVFQKLIEASELLGSLYEQQKDVRYPGAGFYPSDAAKQEIETASQKNPAILSPYTFVVRERKGDLKAIPFHVKFKKELKPIAGLLREAAKISDDKNLSRYLESRAKALLTDNYDESNILWLKTEKSKIGCVIGPFDRYLDKIFFKKRAYMAWVGILDEKRTNEAERLNSMIFSSERKFLPGAKKAKIPQIRVRIEDTAIFSGLVADFMFAGNNLPSSADIENLDVKISGRTFFIGDDEYVVGLDRSEGIPIITFSFGNKVYGLKFSSDALLYHSKLKTRPVSNDYSVATNDFVKLKNDLSFVLVSKSDGEWVVIGEEEEYKLPEDYFLTALKINKALDFIRFKC